MKASIQAVAAEAGVSISTVSRTFAKPNLVLPETRSKVMAAAEKLDYRISRSAAALKTGQSFRVALLMSDSISTWFNSNTYAGLDWCVDRVARYLSYERYHAVQEPPYPEDFKVAEWVVRQGEPNDWICFE